MTDIERTLDQQPGAPDADASGDSGRPGCAGGATPPPDAHRSGGEPAAQPTDGDPGSRASEQDAEEVQGDLDELLKTAAQRDEYLALAQRTQADFENYRKRVARESSAAQERGMAALAQEV